LLLDSLTILLQASPAFSAGSPAEGPLVPATAQRRIYLAAFSVCHFFDIHSRGTRLLSVSLTRHGMRISASAPKEI
jgi:hypothetical protein